MPSPLSSALRLRDKFLLSTALAAALGAAGTSAAAQADGPNVVTSIKPLHSIASAVMEGVGTPHIVIDGAASPHGFALKPSQAFLLEGADVVFWMGSGLTPSLEKPITSMAADAETITLMDVDGIEHLGLREGANFDAHDHDHEDHEGHDHEDHAKHDDHEGHDHEDHAEHDDQEGHDHEDHAEHDDHEGHGHEEHAEHDGEKDVHIWLNPDNGIAIAGHMADTLARLDPDNADTYWSNAKKFAENIEELEHEIEHMLEPAKGKKFIVFHDAYHHFEHHFDIEASGAITISPEALASADRVAEVRDRITDIGVTCVFQEPQFEAKLVDVVLEGSGANKGTLDPLGTELQNGPGLYPALLKGIATSIAECLAGK